MNETHGEDGFDLPGCLHDATLTAIRTDWIGGVVVVDVRMDVSDGEDERWADAAVGVEGLVYCSIQPPEIDESRGYVPRPPQGPWIDAGVGRGDESLSRLLPPTPAGCFLWWIFVRQWNRFIHICGRDARLEFREQPDATLTSRA